MWIGSDPTRSGRALELPCGRCVGCKQDRARDWMVRIVHESQLYQNNWFVTFTYREEDLPESRSLEYGDFQSMMKRLRRRVRGCSPGPEGNYPLRFFCAGEYGSLRQRPHFHAIMFNLFTGDEQRLANGAFRSTLLEDVWKKGGVYLDRVTRASAAYVAGYTQKKVYGRTAVYEDVVNLRTGEVSERRKEFAVMSRRPGIGAWWYARFASDLWSQDHAVVDGKRNKVPRYYLEKFRRDGDAARVEEVLEARYQRAMECKQEGTPERRAVREEYALRRDAVLAERSDF